MVIQKGKNNQKTPMKIRKSNIIDGMLEDDSMDDETVQKTANRTPKASSFSPVKVGGKSKTPSKNAAKSTPEKKKTLKQTDDDDDDDDDDDEDDDDFDLDADMDDDEEEEDEDDDEEEDEEEDDDEEDDEDEDDDEDDENNEVEKQEIGKSKKKAENAALTPESKHSISEKNPVVIEDERRRSEWDAKHLHIADLSADITVEDIKDLSKDINRVKIVIEADNKRHAVLGFKTEEKAEKNLDVLREINIKGHTLTVGKVKDQSPNETYDLKMLHLVGVNSDCPLHEIALFFPKAMLIKFKFFKDTDYKDAYIEFSSEQDCTEAFTEHESIKLRNIHVPVLHSRRQFQKYNKPTANTFTNGGQRGMKGGKSCFKCGKQGHMSMQCTSNVTNGQKSCFKCGKLGHISMQCKSSGSNNRTCYQCGEAGHLSRDCSNSRNKSSKRACFKCGEEGHMSRECPSGGDSKNAKKSCFKCGEEGHMSRECPSGESKNAKKSCFKCGEEGHMSRECPSGESSNAKKACFKCGEEGHMSRECPSGGDSRTCYNCNEKGHLSRECPKKGAMGKSSPKKRMRNNQHEMNTQSSKKMKTDSDDE